MKRPQAIAITSGKGGVGKTNLSVNLALALQRSTKNVAVFDADLALANAHLVLGCRASRTIVDAISGRCAVQDVLVSGPSGLKLIAGGSGLAELMSLSDEKRQSIISSISSIAPQIDYLIVDTAAGVEDNVIDFVAACDRVIVVVVGEPTAFVDAYASIKVLHQETGRTQFDIVVNRATNDTQGIQIFQRFQAIVSKFLPVALHHIGSIPNDERLGRAVSKCEPVIDSFPEAPASKAILSIAQVVLASPPPVVDEGAVGFFRPFYDRDVAAAEAMS